MDAGVIEPGGPDEQQPPNPSRISPNGADELEARAAARLARAAADVETLAGDPYLTDALARLQAAIADVADARWSARGPAVLTAALRALTREQSRLDAATPRLIADVDARDDVVPRAKPKCAGAALLRTALGVERRKATREAEVARLVSGDRPDLDAVGTAYAAGDISRGHLDAAVSVHRRLGANCRESARSLVDPDTRETTERRTIEAVDATLAARARDFTVTELGRIGHRLVENLNPPTPDGAHSRRYLNLSPLPDGSLLGRFCLDPVQSLAFLAVITTLTNPKGIWRTPSAISRMRAILLDQAVACPTPTRTAVIRRAGRGAGRRPRRRPRPAAGGAAARRPPPPRRGWRRARAAAAWSRR
jgi:hypothetical protein